MNNVTFTSNVSALKSLVGVLPEIEKPVEGLISTSSDMASHIKTHEYFNPYTMIETVEKNMPDIPNIESTIDGMPEGFHINYFG